jgi:hypothetical protein
LILERVSRYGGRIDPTRRVSTLLEILGRHLHNGLEDDAAEHVSTLLEILDRYGWIRDSCIEEWEFQPFLRFYHSCGWLLWVFKFFFGFL